MSVATVVTEGFGTFGNTSFVVTDGYGDYAGGEPEPPATPPATNLYGKYVCRPKYEGKVMKAR